MKFTLSFKTPDVLDQAFENTSSEEQEAIKKIAKKFIEFGEYICVEFDTETQTATVQEA